MKGCGKDRGFRLVLDSREMLYSTSNDTRPTPKGYRVLVTMNGVVTSNLPYYVASDFDGEHDFYIHGIHNIVVS